MVASGRCYAVGIRFYRYVDDQGLSGTIVVSTFGPSSTTRHELRKIMTFSIKDADRGLSFHSR